MLVAMEGTLWLTLFPGSSYTPGGDSREYQLLASNLLHHGVYSESTAPPYYESVVRSPGYPAFLVPFAWIGASHAAVVGAAQFGVVAATAVLVGWIGRQVVGPTVGTVAAVLCATYLPFLALAPRFLTEDLGSFCLTVVVALLLVARRSDRALFYVASGLALAVLTYVRPEFILLALPIAMALLIGSKGASWRSAARWSRCLAFTAPFVLVLVPWTIRDASVTGGKVVPMAATSGSDLLASADQYSGYITYKFTIPDWNRYRAQVGRLINERGNLGPRAQVYVDDQLRSAAVRIFKSLSVGQIIRSLPKRLAYLWGTADFPPPGRWTGAFHHLAQLQYAVLLLLALIGFALRRRALVRDWPLWITAAYLSVVHLVFHIEGRYTLPARPPLMIYASVGLLATVAVIRWPLQRPAELSRVRFRDS